MSDDLQAVADMLRSHERFLLVTHENPDGDALGSLLAAKLGLDSLGKDAQMYLYGDAPLPTEYSFMNLDGLLRGAPPECRRSGARGARLRQRVTNGAGPGVGRARAAHDRHRPPP